MDYDQWRATNKESDKRYEEADRFALWYSDRQDDLLADWADEGVGRTAWTDYSAETMAINQTGFLRYVLNNDHYSTAFNQYCWDEFEKIGKIW